MTQDELKAMVGRAALAYVEPGQIVGVGTGSTVNHFIDALAGIAPRVELARDHLFLAVKASFDHAAQDVPRLRVLRYAIKGLLKHNISPQLRAWAARAHNNRKADREGAAARQPCRLGGERPAQRFIHQRRGQRQVGIAVLK